MSSEAPKLIKGQGIKIPIGFAPRFLQSEIDKQVSTALSGIAKRHAKREAKHLETRGQLQIDNHYLPQIVELKDKVNPLRRRNAFEDAKLVAGVPVNIVAGATEALATGTLATLKEASRIPLKVNAGLITGLIALLATGEPLAVPVATTAGVLWELKSRSDKKAAVNSKRQTARRERRNKKEPQIIDVDVKTEPEKQRTRRSFMGKLLPVAAIIAGVAALSREKSDRGSSEVIVAANISRDASLLQIQSLNTEKVERAGWMPGWMPETVVKWQDLIEQEANSQGVGPKLIACMMTAESCGHPTIRSFGSEGNNDRATGLMQVMTFNAQGSDLTNPAQNIRVGVSYLKDMYSTFGSWETAVLAYNQGPGNTINGILTDQGQSYQNWVMGMFNDVNDGSGETFQKWKESGGQWLYDQARIYQEIVKSNPLSQMQRSQSVDFWKPSGFQANHTGLDYIAPLGTPYLSIIDGNVVWTDWLMAPRPYGHGLTTVVKAHNYPVYYVYAHGSGNFKVEKGNDVFSGEELDTSGATGALSGPHLHLGVWVGGEFIADKTGDITKPFSEGGWKDPMAWLPTGQNYPPFN